MIYGRPERVSGSTGLCAHSSHTVHYLCFSMESHFSVTARDFFYASPMSPTSTRTRVDGLLVPTDGLPGSTIAGPSRGIGRLMVGMSLFALGYRQSCSSWCIGSRHGPHLYLGPAHRPRPIRVPPETRHGVLGATARPRAGHTRLAHRVSQSGSHWPWLLRRTGPLPVYISYFPHQLGRTATVGN
jgi:hypothetical protein